MEANKARKQNHSCWGIYAFRVSRRQVRRRGIQWTLDGQPVTSWDIVAVAVVVLRTAFILRHCFSCSSDTQLKMYSIETRQQVRGINLSSMVGCFAHKFEFCVTPSSYKPTKVEYMLCINILTLSLSVKRWGLPLDWLTVLAKCWTISKSDT